MGSNLILVLNEALPADLRSALEGEAEDEQVTVNDVAGRAIAAHYALDWDLSGNPYRPLASRFKLHVTEEMRRELARDAFESGHTMRGVALNLLANHYGTTPIDPKRRPRKEFA